MSFSIAEKATLITGGTAGIGYATARHFAKHGAKVVISGRRETGAEIAKQIGCYFVTADMASLQDIEQLFCDAKSHLGALDVVINNAGIGGEVRAIADTDMQDFESVININMRAAFKVLQLAPGYMNDGGSIINTASISGMEGEIGSSSYSASKAAIINLTKTSALELACRNIRVNAISPGPVKSEIWQGEDPLQWSRLVIPLGRIGESSELAEVFHFLASSAASFITGANLPVDGGYMSGRSRQLDNLINASLDAVASLDQT
jgi:3alpha(or 20beta)-hydroxysteroid dehydrogenase